MTQPTNPPDAPPGIDEHCLQLAIHCLSAPTWTDADRENLARALQQTVMDFIWEFHRP